MLSLKKCLTDIANFMGISNNSLRVGKILIQWGASSKTVAAHDADRNTITFAQSYSQTPVVFAQSTSATNFVNLYMCGVSTVSTTQFFMTFQNTYTSSYMITGNWLAIGVA